MQGPCRLLKDSWNELSALYNLWNDDQGQDLIEYTLLLAFVILATAGIFLGWRRKCLRYCVHQQQSTGRGKRERELTGICQKSLARSVGSWSER